MLNELKIHYFLTLAEYMNFSEAAKALHITQQALSKQISNLEQELDCSLFWRTGRGIILTDSGLAMKKAFHAMRSNLDQALLEIHNSDRLRERVLNIGCAAGLRPGPFINPIVREYAEKNNVKFWLGQPDTYSDLITWLSEGKFDMVLCTDDYGGLGQELKSLRMCRTPFYYFVSREHPNASPAAELKDFRDLNFYVTDNTVRTDHILSLCAKDRFVPQNLNSTANCYSTHLMVEAGESLAFGTGFCVLHSNPAVRAYRLKDEEVHLTCLWKPEQLTALSGDFIDYLASACDEERWYYPTYN